MSFEKEKVDKKYFTDLLDNIQNNHSLIKQISSFMFYHRELNAYLLTDLWKKHFLSCFESNKLLLLFYIINEIIILSAKKQKYEYISSFGEILNEIILNLTLKSEKGGSCVLIKVFEMIELWELLMIFSTSFTSKLLKIIKEKVR